MLEGDFVVDPSADDADPWAHHRAQVEAEGRGPDPQTSRGSSSREQDGVPVGGSGRGDFTPSGPSDSGRDNREEEDDQRRDFSGGSQQDEERTRNMYYPERSAMREGGQHHRGQRRRSSSSDRPRQQVRVMSPGSVCSSSSRASRRSYSSSGTSRSHSSYGTSQSHSSRRSDHSSSSYRSSQRGAEEQQKSQRVTRAGIDSALNAAIAGRDARLREGNFGYEDNDSVFNRPIEGISVAKKNTANKRAGKCSTKKRQMLQSSEGFVNCL